MADDFHMIDANETPAQRAARTRAERIREARAELQRRYDEDPAGVQRFNQRTARLAAAKRREQQRIDHLVLGHDRPTKKVSRPRRKGKRHSVTVPVRLEDGIEEAVAQRERWSHKAHATAETMDYATRTHQGALVQLHANGAISTDQLEYAAQIENVHRSIGSDVTVAIASLEARVDNSAGARNVLGESIYRVRMHAAYGYWRAMLPHPKRLVLDMLVGEPIGFSVAAARHRVHKRKAKRLLIDALNRWPACVMQAFAAVDDDTVYAMNGARRSGYVPNVVVITPRAEPVMIPQPDAGVIIVARPQPIRPVDPDFLDDNGRMKPWGDIAKIIRTKFADDVDIAA